MTSAREHGLRVVRGGAATGGPMALQSWIGHEAALAPLRTAIVAARMQARVLPHVLASGPPGCGKTRLARAVADELDVPLVERSAPVLGARDVGKVIADVADRGILFLDEVHRLTAAATERLHADMDAARVTVIGATTRPGSVAQPFRSRFALAVRLDLYDLVDLARIVTEAEPEQLADGVALEIARRSRGTPRIALGYLRAVLDRAAVDGATVATLDTARASLDAAGVDAYGLTAEHRRYLAVLAQHGEAVGLGTLAAALGEPVETIEAVVEPWLLRLGVVARTARGRSLTASVLGQPGATARKGELW